MHEQFNQQKETATLLVKNSIFYSIFTLPFAILLFIGGSELIKGSSLLLFIFQSIVFLALCIFVLLQLVHNIRLRIAFGNVAHLMEDTKEIICANVHFLTLFDNSSHGFTVAGFIFTDAQKKKYYYLFPVERNVSNDYRKFIKSKCLGHQLTIKYYAGTNLIIDPPFTLYDYDY